jgi:hypothetical protein
MFLDTPLLGLLLYPLSEIVHFLDHLLNSDPGFYQNVRHLNFIECKVDSFINSREKGI